MIKKIDDDLYIELSNWWIAHKMKPVDRSLLPPLSWVYHVDNKPIIAAFMYKGEGCKFCMFTWVISNPNSEYEQRKEGINQLIIEASKKAKELGASVILSNSDTPSLIKHLESNGFHSYGENFTQLVKAV